MHRTRVIAFTVPTPFYFLKYTILLTAVIGSAVVPTLIAQRWLQPAFKPLAAETPTNVPAVAAALELARQTSAKVHMVAVEELPRFPASIDEVAEEKDEANHRFAPVIESARAEAAAAGCDDRDPPCSGTRRGCSDRADQATECRPSRRRLYGPFTAL
jgi:hypothetical protein